MKRILLIITVLSFSFGIAAPVAAVAQADRSEDVIEAAKKTASEKRKSKEERIAKIKADTEARKLALTQEKCEAREEKLQKLVPKLSNSANRLKTVIDRKYDRVVTFYDEKEITVENYETLVADIELAKANAEASMETLETYEVEVDCEQSGIGGQLDAYRTAVKEARDDLKEYRKALIALITSVKVKAEATEAEEDTETEEENTEETTNEGGETENETE